MPDNRCYCCENMAENRNSLLYKLENDKDGSDSNMDNNNCFYYHIEDEREARRLAPALNNAPNYAFQPSNLVGQPLFYLSPELRNIRRKYHQQNYVKKYEHYYQYFYTYYENFYKDIICLSPPRPPPPAT